MNAKTTNAKTRQLDWRRSYISLSVLLLVTALLAVFSGKAYSDQNAPELPALFDALSDATQAQEAERIELQIWAQWLQPPDAQAARLMSQIASAMAASDMAVAIEYCDELVQSHPDYAEGWNKRATLHYMMGNNAQSVADIRRTIALEPRHFGAISGLGMIFLKEGDQEAALKAFEQVLSISPASAGAQMSVARLRQEQGREI